jgi:hypothetical protein
MPRSRASRAATPTKVTIPGRSKGWLGHRFDHEHSGLYGAAPNRFKDFSRERMQAVPVAIAEQAWTPW